jgi:hypothetical protein
MTTDIATPQPKTWVDLDDGNSLVRVSDMNAQLRDSLNFVVSGCQITVQRQADQSIPNNNDTAISWDTELEDTDDILTVPDSAFTFVRDGVIAVRAYTTFGQAGGGKRRRLILRYTPAGGAEIDVACSSDGPGSNNPSVCLSTALPVMAGDKVKFWVWQDSGGSLSISGGQTAAVLAWVGKVAPWENPDDPAPTPTPDPSPPPPKADKHTKTYSATWSRSFDGDLLTTWDDSPYCYQGYYSDDRGNTRSLVGFDSASIVSDLKGATNITMDLTYYVTHSYYWSGLSVILGGHRYSAKPSSWALASVDADLQHQFAKYQATNTLTLNSTIASRIQTGEYKGVAFGPGPTTSPPYYGYISGATKSSHPTLKVTYWK